MFVVSYVTSHMHGLHLGRTFATCPAYVDRSGLWVDEVIDMSANAYVIERIV